MWDGDHYSSIGTTKINQQSITSAEETLSKPVWTTVRRSRLGFAERLSDEES